LGSIILLNNLFFYFLPKFPFLDKRFPLLAPPMGSTWGGYPWFPLNPTFLEPKSYRQGHGGKVPLLGWFNKIIPTIKFPENWFNFFFPIRGYLPKKKGFSILTSPSFKKAFSMKNPQKTIYLSLQNTKSLFGGKKRALPPQGVVVRETTKGLPHGVSPPKRKKIFL